MNNKLTQIVFCFAWLLAVGVAPMQAAERDETACAESVEKIRTDSLTFLYQSEEYFKDAAWHFRKSQELIYRPLWEAVQMRRDRYAGFRKNSDGEILYQRYRARADQEKMIAGEKMEAAIEEMRRLKRNHITDSVCGRKKDPKDPGDTISLFGNCMEIWQKETDDLVAELIKTLKKYAAKEQGFTAKLEEHLKDSISDHDKFEERFRDYFSDLDIKTRTAYYALTRKISEKFELSWPGEKCCVQCTLEKRSDRDPVLSQVKLDPQGDLGAAGTVVNTARLVPAFDQLDSENERAIEQPEERKR